MVEDVCPLPGAGQNLPFTLLSPCPTLAKALSMVRLKTKKLLVSGIAVVVLNFLPKPSQQFAYTAQAQFLLASSWNWNLLQPTHKRFNSPWYRFPPEIFDSHEDFSLTVEISEVGFLGGFLPVSRKVGCLKKIINWVDDFYLTKEHFLRKKMTYYTWLVTHDMWHMTCDMWNMGQGTFSHNLRSLAHTVWDLRCFEDIFTKDHQLTPWTYNQGICRTAPATRGLLSILIFVVVVKLCLWNYDLD